MEHSVSPSSRGLGHRVLIPATWVRIPLEMPFFLPFFQDPLRNPRKKQATAWQIYLPAVAFSFCFGIFCTAKNGITHLLSHCLALLALWGCVTQALRRSAPRGDAIFLPFFSTSHRKRVIPAKSNQWLWKINFPRHCFFFLL